MTRRQVSRTPHSDWLPKRWIAVHQWLDFDHHVFSRLEPYYGAVGCPAFSVSGEGAVPQVRLQAEHQEGDRHDRGGNR